MNILVTGGAGFIGSNLCEALLKKGHFVRCMDNLSTGKAGNIEHLIASYPETFQFYKADICSLSDCNNALQNIEYVLHEAALGSVPRSIKDPINTNMNNINGFLNMLVASRDAGVKRFVYAASSSTYGDSKSLPKVEDVIGKPLSPYAVTKLVNELYADVFSKTYGMECIGLRYFNVYGRRQDPNGAYAAVIPLFVKQLIAHQPITINGDGEFSRDFTYVDNVVHMNLLALQTDNPQAVNQIFNTACGERTSLNQLVAYLKEYLSEFDSEISKVEVHYGPNRLGDIPHSLASIEKAGTLLGYHPLFTVKQGIKEAVKWYWENL